MIRGLENMTYTESSKELQLFHVKVRRLMSVVTVFKRKDLFVHHAHHEQKVIDLNCSKLLK